jgi:hypothetical protein
LNDADNISDEGEVEIEQDLEPTYISGVYQSRFAFKPCAAHNIQLGLLYYDHFSIFKNLLEFNFIKLHS